MHRSKDWIGADESNLEGIPVTTVHRTLIDLPAVMKEEALEIALDSALSQRLTSVSFMWRRLNRLGGRGRSGSALLRKMLVERTGLTQHAQNGAETKLVRLLQQRGLDGFVKQFTIRSGRESLARVDLAWPALRLGVELDSWRYHTSTSARRRDARRQNAIERLRWTILRFFWEDVIHDADYVVDEIGHTRMALGGRPLLEWHRSRVAG